MCNEKQWGMVLRKFYNLELLCMLAKGLVTLQSSLEKKLSTKLERSNKQTIMSGAGSGDVDRWATSCPSESAAQRPACGYPRAFAFASPENPCLGLLPSPYLPLGPTEPVTMRLRLGDLAPLPMGVAPLLHGAVTSVQGTPQPGMEV